MKEEQSINYLKLQLWSPLTQCSAGDIEKTLSYKVLAAGTDSIHIGTLGQIWPHYFLSLPESQQSTALSQLLISVHFVNHHFQAFVIFPLNVVTAKRHYRCHGITAPYLPSPQYYRNFPHPRSNYRGYRGITAFPITVSSSRSYHGWGASHWLKRHSPGHVC